MSRTIVYVLLLSFSLSGCQQTREKKTTGPVNTVVTPKEVQNIPDRQLWLEHLDKLAGPILTNLANDELKKKYAGCTGSTGLGA